MFSFNNKTYFFTPNEMISVDNSKDFISAMLEALIETLTTSHPTMFRLINGTRIFTFIIGYNDILIMIKDNENIEVQTLSKDLFEFTEEIISQKDKILQDFEHDEKTQKKFSLLYDELILCSVSSVEVYTCYDIRKKTIDDLLYAFENNKQYVVIYDQLDDLSESYRVITKTEMYIISLNPLSIEIEHIKIGLKDFANLLHNELKSSKNVIIRRTLKKLNEYIKD